VSKYSPELGQVAFGNTWAPIEADWATDGLRLLSEALCETLGEDADLSNSGTDYENESFAMRKYWWGKEDTPEAQLANFEHKPTGLKIHWYKYLGRGMSANTQRPKDWPKLIASLILTLKEKGAP